MSYSYNICGGDSGLASLWVMIGSEFFELRSDDPSYDAAVTALKANRPEAEVLRILSPINEVRENLASVGDTDVEAIGNTVYVAGEPVSGAIADHILRFVHEGVEDWQPLVQFLLKVRENPNPHSQAQLYDWIRTRVTISPIGNIVAYKGVKRDGDSFYSVHAGDAIVDGKPVKGHVPNRPGTTVEMIRDAVDFDPQVACSRGLHVGTFDYAQGWSCGGMLEVHVNPRDVVSVPADGGGEKIRVCKYIVAGAIATPYTELIAGEPLDEYDSMDDYHDA